MGRGMFWVVVWNGTKEESLEIRWRGFLHGGPDRYLDKYNASGWEVGKQVVENFVFF